MRKQYFLNFIGAINRRSPLSPPVCLLLLLVVVLLAGVLPPSPVLASGRPAPASAGPPYQVSQQPGSSAGTILLGPNYGITGMHGGMRLGHDYNFSLNGPLLLSVETSLVIGGRVLGIQIIPGVKYRLDPLPGGIIPHIKGGLATDLYHGSHRRSPMVLSARVGTGIRYFFTSRLGFGLDWDLQAGLTGGDQTQGALGTGIAIAFEYLVP